MVVFVCLCINLFLYLVVLLLTDQTKYLYSKAHSPHLLSVLSFFLSSLTQWFNGGRVGFPWQLLPLPVCVKGSIPLKFSSRFLLLPFHSLPLHFPPLSICLLLPIFWKWRRVKHKHTACLRWNLNPHLMEVFLKLHRNSGPCDPWLFSKNVDKQCHDCHHSSQLCAQDGQSECVCVWAGGEADWQGGTQMWMCQVVSVTRCWMLVGRCSHQMWRGKGVKFAP